MMMPLLVFRERVKNFYQKNDIFLTPIIKFFFALITFIVINKQIGYDQRIEKLPIVLVLSLLCAFVPSSIMVLIAAGVAFGHIYFISKILSIIILLALFVLYLLFVRFTPNLGYVVLAVPILFILKVPYLIPLLLGLISTPIAIIPMSCGAVVYFMFDVVKSAATIQVKTTAEDVLQLYTYVVNNLISNKQMIMTIIIFALVLVATYFVRKMKFDYAFEISIAVGALTSLLGFLISDLFLDRTNQILIMIMGTIVSAGIVYIIHFFELTLDYSGVENVQFEDDVYYYYVKAVPKVSVTTPQVNVKHINVKKVGHYLNKTAKEQEPEDIDIDDEFGEIDLYDNEQETDMDRKRNLDE